MISFKLFLEDATVAVGSGQVDGIGFGPKGEPGVTPEQAKKYKKKNEDEAKELGINEKLNPKQGVAAYIRDFEDSDAPQFEGKNKKQRRKMAIAAYLSAKDKS